MVGSIASMRRGSLGVPSVASVRFAVRDSPAQAKRAVSGWPTRVGCNRRRRLTQTVARPRTVLTGEMAWRTTTRSSTRTARIKFPDNTDLVRHVEKWAKVRGDQLAYRFLDFSTERDGVAKDISWAEFGARNRAVGARLQQVTQPGDRVAILCPQSLDYLSAFFGTLYAGRIAVPLFDPAEPGHVGRLHAVLDDCTPSAILTTSDSAEGVRKFFRSRPAKERPRVIAVDAVPDEVGATWEPVPADHRDHRLSAVHLRLHPHPDRRRDHASEPAHQRGPGDRRPGGQGRRPRRQLAAVLPRHGPDHRACCRRWSASSFTFMTPAAFVRRPSRWIRELARKEGDNRPDVLSAAPNFAFEHAALRGLPKEGEPPLDLSNVKAILNGSEPVSAASIRKFNEAFAPYGFQEKAIKPSYGLAEATLFVSTTPMDEPPKIIHVDREALNNQPVRRGGRRRAERASRRPPPARSVSTSGRSSSTPRPPPNCPTGRSARSGCTARTWAPATGTGKQETTETFKNILKSRTNPSRAEGAPDDGIVGAHRRLRHLPRRSTSTSPAGSRTWSSSTGATTTRRTWSTRRRKPAGRCAPATWPRSRCRPTSCPRRCSTTRTPG